MMQINADGTTSHVPDRCNLLLNRKLGIYCCLPPGHDGEHSCTLSWRYFASADGSMDVAITCADHRETVKAAREECARMCEDKAEECIQNPGTPFSRCADARLSEVAEQIRRMM